MMLPRVEPRHLAREAISIPLSSIFPKWPEDLKLLHCLMIHRGEGGNVKGLGRRAKFGRAEDQPEPASARIDCFG